MRVTVYAGSSVGNRPVFAQEADRFAAHLAQRGCDIVYGGGSAGLMGVVAEAALAHGGKVIGVMPRSLADAGVAHTSLSELHIVESMRERQAMMERLGDCFVALPGDVDTLTQLFEVWASLMQGHHSKPVMLLNTENYWNRLLSLAIKSANYGFMTAEEGCAFIPIHSADDIFDVIAQWFPPATRWSVSTPSYPPPLPSTETTKV